MKKSTILFCMLGLACLLSAQNNSTHSPIIFIYDASGSMWGKLEGKTKKEIATGVLSSTVQQLPEGQRVGLVAYGHRRKGDCEDVEFLVEMDNADKEKVTQSLQTINPLGKTPLAWSATQVIDKLRTARQKATVILVTDGIESCDGDICSVIKAAREEGIDFKLHIIGFGLKADETEQLRCAARAADGQYYDATDAEGLSSVLNEATSTTVDDPPANFTVFAVKNGRPIDAYVKAYKTGTETAAGTVRTYADTGHFYLPAGAYDLRVQPLEGSDVEAITIANVQSQEGKTTHRTVSFDGGKLVITTFNNEEGWDAVVKIFAPDGKKVTGGRTYGRVDEYELNPGTYNIELEALKIQGLQTTHRIGQVVVKAGETQEVEHRFVSGIAMIGAKSADGLVDAVVSIKDADSKKNVAGGRTYTSASNNPKQFILNPGTYEVTLTTLGKHKGKKETFTLTVEAGATTGKTIDF